MLALYTLTLGVSAGLVGVFARHVLGGLGFVAGFESGVMLAAAMGSAYAALQLAYMALLRLLQPNRSINVYITEILSHLAALVFAPYLLHIEVPWPHPDIARVEPLVYLAGFLALHGFLKLATFYASLHGEAGRRWPVIGWSGAAALALWGAYAGFDAWRTATEQARPAVSDETALYRIGDEFARARPVPEGGVLDVAFNPAGPASVALRVAAPPGDAPTVDAAYFTLELIGPSGTRSYVDSAPARTNGWAEIRVPAATSSGPVHRCRIRWSRHREPRWQRLLGIRPVVFTHAGQAPGPLAPPPRLLVSGPFAHRARTETAPARPDAERPNILLIAVDGLAPARMSAFNYERDTTPSLKRLGATALVFPNTFAPSTDPLAGAASLLTGLAASRHGLFSTANTSLRPEISTLPELLHAAGYTTAAFWEPDNFTENSTGIAHGFEQRFELFHVVTPLSAPNIQDEGPGAATAVQRAITWIEENHDVHFFGFIRQRSPGRNPPSSNPPPDPGQAYDAALEAVDREIGALIKHVRDRALRNSTAIIIVGASGLDFTDGRPVPALTEAGLRTALFLAIPGQIKEPRPDLAGTEDVAVVAAHLAGTRFDTPVDGRNLLFGPTERPVLSMTPSGDYSLRVPQWRYERISAVERLFRESNRDGWWREDVSARFPDTAAELRRRFSALVDEAAMSVR